MAQIKPSLAKGTRDFSPQEMERRNYIFNTIRKTFEKYGYNEIQTPSFENLNTLTGKYGEEGDQLIFKILNSGDFKSKVNTDEYSNHSSQSLTPKISDKALRYDLTVPFARYVVMHQHEIAFPFKRYQIQPVWRADRPQRGRYREFYQCDADVVGSDSLLNEAEFVIIYKEVLTQLGLKDFNIKFNNRKILSGIAEMLGREDLIIPMTVAIDKLDKIGTEGVEKELIQRGFSDEQIDKLRPIFALNGTNTDKLSTLQTLLSNSEIGLLGIGEIRKVMDYIHLLSPDASSYFEVDITLARGLNYYTGSIIEVKTNEVTMGSIGGGGRYDDLTGMFGLKGISGVGISFGADRIYDVLDELKLFPSHSMVSTQVLITNFDTKAESYALPILQRLRDAGISAELYPNSSKLKRQMTYADAKNIPFVLLIGDTEMESGQLSLKNMHSGDQQTITEDALIDLLSSPTL
jgi:histidyl-tRNA synthetase